MLRHLPRVGAAAALAGAYVASEYRTYLDLQADAAVEARLPSSEEAQRTKVVRIPRLLSDEEIEAVHALHARTAGALGSAGRNAANQAASYRNGVWETSYLSTSGIFGAELPQLREKLIAAAREVDEARVYRAVVLYTRGSTRQPRLDHVPRHPQAHWGLLRCATHPVAPRCVEYHRVSASGSLPFAGHHDAGSLVTIDVMLADRSHFRGGELCTAEADGTTARHTFERGDALVFVSMKPHSVRPVTGGERSVLVMELWEGEERACGHRCERHWGPCNHTAWDSFWRRAFQDIASDLDR